MELRFTEGTASSGWTMRLGNEQVDKTDCKLRE